MCACIYLSECVSVQRVSPGVVVLIDEVLVLLSLPLQCLFSPVNIGRQVALYV